MKGRRFLRALAISGIGCVWVIADRGTMSLAAQSRAVDPARTQPAKESAKTPTSFGIGRPATPAEIATWDIDVRPDGTGLPPGQAMSADGEPIYAARCASCHGKTGKEGPNDRLVGREPREGFPFGRDPSAVKTIGNYWPYATTVFDYIRRAMPTDAPGSLKDEEVYALTAYLLFLNELIPADAVIDRATLPKIVMPARDRFVPDTRGGPRTVQESPKRR